MTRAGARFSRVEPRRRARAFVLGLLAELPRKNCWTIAEHAGDRTPDGMQHLLSRARWDANGVRDDVRSYVVEQLGDPGAVLVVDLCRSWNYAEAACSVTRTRLVGRASGGGRGGGARHSYRLSRKASSGSAGR